MEAQQMYMVLKAVSKGEGYLGVEPEYMKGLITVGLVTHDWDYALTPLGRSVLSMLQSQFEKW